MTSVGWIKYLDIFSIPLWIWTMSTSYFVPEWSMALDDFRWNHSGWEMMSGWHQMNKWDQMLFFYHYVDPDPNSYLVSDWSVLMTMDDYRCNHCGWDDVWMTSARWLRSHLNLISLYKSGPWALILCFNWSMAIDDYGWLYCGWDYIWMTSFGWMRSVYHFMDPDPEQIILDHWLEYVLGL